MIGLGQDDPTIIFSAEVVEQLEREGAERAAAEGRPPEPVELTPGEIAYLCQVIRSEDGIIAECQNPACYGLNPSGCDDVFAAQNATVGPELQAWVMLTSTLELPPSAPLAEVNAALVAKGIPPDDVADWLPACNYDVNCFRETLHEEFYKAEQRQATAGVAKAGALIGLVVIVGASVVALRGRR